MRESPLVKLVGLARKTGVLRPRDLARHKIDREYLRIAQERGLIKRLSRGLYIAADAELTEHHSLAAAGARVPQGVVCLLSALRFHDLTTAAPFEVWMAIGEKAHRPKLDSPPLRIMRFSGRMLTYGVQTESIENIPVKVFTPAKTVADCFRFRNKIGLDLALEALRDALRKRKMTVDQIWDAAKVCRISKVIRPYLEATV